MVFLSILILLVALALPSLKNNLPSLHITRISAIIFIYSGVLALHALHIQAIGSGIGIYSGLFHVTIISQLLDGVILILGGMILLSWPIITSNYYDKIAYISTFFKDGSSLLSIQKLIVTIRPTMDKAQIKELIAKITVTGLYIPRTEYSLIVLFSVLGTSLLLSSSDLVSMFLSIEFQSFSLYLLSTLYKDYDSSTSAGLKYFLLGALSSCFILLGAGIIYSYTGLTNFESLYTLMSVSWDSHQLADINIYGVHLGLVFIFLGLLFKIAAAPLHSWSPDVYDGTPTQVTMWLTIIPKIGILFLLLEFYSGFSINIFENWPLFEWWLDLNLYNPHWWNIHFNTSYVLQTLFLIMAFISFIVGSLTGLAQTRIKRLLAYSTVSHIGFILLALSINNWPSIDACLFYIIQYSITNLNIFLILLAMGYILHYKGVKINFKVHQINLFDYDIRSLTELKGLLYREPILSFSLIISILSLTGIPPFIGFFAKQNILYSGISSEYNLMVLLAILTSVVAASYYLRIITLLISEIDNNENVNYFFLSDQTIVNTTILTNVHSFLISTLTIFISLFIIKPQLLLNSTQLLTIYLFNH